MLYVIATGGKQLVVKTGDVVRVEKLPGNTGDAIQFSTVLLTADDQGEQVEVGRPTVAGAQVKATITKQGRSPKLRVEKFKRKIRYHKVYGHRQHFTEVKIA